MATETVIDFSVLLLDILAHSGEEFASLLYIKPGGGAAHCAVYPPAEAVATAAKLPTDADCYFGVNPVTGPARTNAGRGSEADVTRLAGLWVDLDLKPGGCPSLDVANAIISELSIFVGTRPSALVYSGGGLHAYWPILDGHDIPTARTILKRWGRAVAVVAGKLNVDVDNVYDLARVLRLPGSFNHKTGEPRPVTAYADGGHPLELAEVAERLDEVGIPERPEDAADSSGEEVSPPAEWRWAEQTCPYLAKMIQGLATDSPRKGRNPWLLSQRVRLSCAHRLGCITAEDYQRAEATLEKRFAELVADPAFGDRREVKRYEHRDTKVCALKKAAAKTDEQARDELGNHKHDFLPAVTEVSGEVISAGGRYFDRAGLLANTLLRDCERLGPLASGIDGKVWAYLDGVWVDGTRVLRERVVTLLGERYRRAHAENVESMVLAREPFINDTPARDYLNVINGLLDWRTGKLRPHTPAVPSTTRIPVLWNPEASCPNIDAFLALVVGPECKPILEEVAGYALYPDQPLHKSVLLDGKGRNGKGTYLRILSALLGEDNIAAVPPQRLDSDRWAVAQLYGRLANLVGDVNPTTFKETATFKMATGQDRLQGEHKYGQPFTFTSRALIVAAFNSLPRSADTTEGFFSRWIVVPFPHRFVDPDDDGNVPPGCLPKDPDLAEKVLTAAEIEGFLVRAVAGLQRVMEQGRFSHAQAVADAEAEFRRHADPVRGFLAESVIADRDGWVSRAELHAAFRTWAIDNSLGVLSAKRFTEKVREVHVEMFGYPASDAKRTGDRGWAGIRLRNFTDDQDDPDQPGHEGHKGRSPLLSPLHTWEKGRAGVPSAPNAPTEAQQDCEVCGGELLSQTSIVRGHCERCHLAAKRTAAAAAAAVGQ